MKNKLIHWLLLTSRKNTVEKQYVYTCGASAKKFCYTNNIDGVTCKKCLKVEFKQRIEKRKKLVEEELSR